MKKYNISRKKLYSLYWKQELTLEEISKIIECSLTTVLYKLREFNLGTRGFKKTQKHKQRISQNHANVSGEKNPAYKGGTQCIDCGKEIYWGNKHCQKCYHKSRLGYKHNNETRKKMSEKSQGKCNSQYIDGRSYESYPQEFTQSLKDKIRKRDDYKCQNCGMTEEEHLIVIGKTLEVHHIDYNKQNCKENNLITLCKQCNLRVNKNRDYWKDHFEEKVEINGTII